MHPEYFDIVNHFQPDMVRVLGESVAVAHVITPDRTASVPRRRKLIVGVGGSPVLTFVYDPIRDTGTLDVCPLRRNHLHVLNKALPSFAEGVTVHPTEYENKWGCKYNGGRNFFTREADFNQSITLVFRLHENTWHFYQFG